MKKDSTELNTHDDITLSIETSVAIITLRGAQNLNAVSLPRALSLTRLLKSATARTDVRSILLRAEGKAFCVGGDLRSFAEAGDQAGLLVKATVDAAHEAILTIATASKPVICAVQGTAAGFGFSLAMSCDLVVASNSATFLSAYTAAGLTPDGGLSFWLPRLAGLRRAQELILTNRMLAAHEAFAAGLVTTVTEDGELEAFSRRQAHDLAAGATGSLAAVKLLLVDPEDLRAHLEREALAIVEASRTLDGVEGVKAFAARRRPIFTTQPGARI